MIIDAQRHSAQEQLDKIEKTSLICYLFSVCTFGEETLKQQEVDGTVLR